MLVLRVRSSLLIHKESKMDVKEIRKRRKDLDREREELSLKQTRLRAEYQFIQGLCRHPGLRLGTDYGGGPDGRCEICGKCW